MIQPPTARLPPIANIAAFTTTQLFDALEYLRSLYLSQVRGSRRRPSSDDAQLLRSDAFERAYAIRWLTALIVRLEKQTSETDRLIQQAASLLAICAGAAAAGKVQRRFTFQSPLAGEIHVVLTDIPLDNHDYASVGAQTWGGACVLAEMIAEHPDHFCLGLGGDPPSKQPLRVLELGAGTGLVGLTVAKLLQASSTNQDCRASIVLTDFYPAVLDNLQSNIDANFTAVSDPIIHVISVSLDWSSFSTTEMKPDILLTPFDVILGADIVYEAQHAVWIRDCLWSLLSRPESSNDGPVFHLVIPLRPTHTFESSMVERIFVSEGRALQPELTILSKESIICEAYADSRGDDVEYVYYRIGWKQ